MSDLVAELQKVLDRPNDWLIPDNETGFWVPRQQLQLLRDELARLAEERDNLRKLASDLRLQYENERDALENENARRYNKADVRMVVCLAIIFAAFVLAVLLNL